MSQSVAVVCEAGDDAGLVAALVTRVVEASRPDWLRDLPADELVEFRGFRPGDGYFAWSSINRLARTHAAFGQEFILSEFTGQFPRDPAALEVLRAVRLLQFQAAVKPDAIVLLKDSDNDPDRRKALRQTDAELSGYAVPVVIGVPHTERECWLLAGFELETAAEREAHQRLCRELSLDPCRESHRLAAPKDSDDRHPKRVLGVLSGGDPAREAACLRAAFLVLEANGRDNGLADFLAALRGRLIHKLFGGPPPEARSA